jgi:hypothetical protein
LFRFIAMIAVCLALGACAQTGRMSLSPPVNRGLAAQGWMEGRPTIGSFDSSARITKSLICTNSRCGGPGYVVVGVTAMPPACARGYRAIMSNPNLTDRKLLADIRRIINEAGTLAGLNGKVIDVHKGVESIRITLSFDQYDPNFGRVYGLAVSDATETQLSLVLAAGPTTAKARERLKLTR